MFTAHKLVRVSHLVVILLPKIMCRHVDLMCHLSRVSWSGRFALSSRASDGQSILSLHEYRVLKCSVKAHHSV